MQDTVERERQTPSDVASKATTQGRLRLSARDLWTAAALAAIVVGALLLRLWWAQYSPALPAPPRFDDSVFYYNMAQNIAEGRGFVHPVSGLATAQWPPGYPAFLAAIFVFTGASVTAAEIANALLGGLTVVLTFALAGMLVRSRVAAVSAAAAVALTPSLILMAGVVWSETLFTALFMAGLVLIALATKVKGPQRTAAIAGLTVVTALAGLTREAGLVLLPTAALFWLTGGGSAREWAPRIAACGVSTLLLILPWTVRNYNTLDIPVFVSSSSAGNFWEGHHGEGISDDIVQEYGPLNRPGGEADVNRAMWRLGAKYALSHPWDEFTGLFSKTRTLYQGDPSGVNLNDAYGTQPFMSPEARDRWLRLSDVGYYSLLVLAGVGLLGAGRRSQLLRMIAPCVLFWTAGHVIFFTDPRFHLPLLPVFGVAAGAGVAWVIAAIARRRPIRAFRAQPQASWALLTLAAAAAVSGGVLLLSREFRSSSRTTLGEGLPVGAAPAIVYARQLCSLSNDDADAAYIQGADGGLSVVVGDRTWWLFGDTLFADASGKQIEQNSIAWSQELRPDGCPRLHYYAGENGVALPFIPKDGSLTVWPSGAWATGDHTLDFYTAYVYGSGPYSYTVGEIGLARLDTETMAVTTLSRGLFTAESGFVSRVINVQPVELGDSGQLRIILQTEAGTKLLARAPLSELADLTAYEYWNGAAWSSKPADAEALWPAAAASATNLELLANFENGAHFAWNEGLRKYVAITNVGYAEVGARVADRLEGPWSEPQPWLDCLTFAEARVPTCYSPLQHPQLSPNGGRTLITTLTRMDRYQSIVLELTLGLPIHEFHRGEEARYAAESPGDGWADEGVAFFASGVELAGFTPVYRWSNGSEAVYNPAPPANGWQRDDEPAFFAPPTAAVAGSLTRYRPVYDWHKDAAHVLSPLTSGLEQYGYTRGEIAFFAP
jgi:4-amino-4-deoxy-L-arabinose transferase-like glycosyltransferase